METVKICTMCNCKWVLSPAYWCFSQHTPMHCIPSLLKQSISVCSMERERLVKKIYRAKVERNRGIGKQWRRWMDEAKGCLSDRGLTIPETKECVKDKREWRRIVGGDVAR